MGLVSPGAERLKESRGPEKPEKPSTERTSYLALIASGPYSEASLPNTDRSLSKDDMGAGRLAV